MPDAPYTPTTDEVRERYSGHNGSDWTRSEPYEFDRWRASVIRAAKAEEAARIFAELRREGFALASFADVFRASSPSESEA